MVQTSAESIITDLKFAKSVKTLLPPHAGIQDIDQYLINIFKVFLLKTLKPYQLIFNTRTGRGGGGQKYYLSPLKGKTFFKILMGG